MKAIYFFKESWEEAYVRERAGDIEWQFYAGTVGENEGVSGEAEILSIFMDSHIGAAEMDRFPNLKLIATRSTGFDHIDLSEAERRGVVVCNVPRYGGNTVAEHTFALLLALSRRIYDAYKQVAEEGSFTQEGLRGFDLAGKTIGVVGCGNIGRHVVRIARGFDMRVVVYDPYPDHEFAKSAGADVVSLSELLASSDIVTLHVPLSPETTHLLNKDNLATLKRGAYIVNTARGGLIDTEALVWALKEGIVGGAGLDVLEEEDDMAAGEHLNLLLNKHPSLEELRTILANHYLIDHPRVIITPHIAFNTNEAVRRILETTLENIKAFQGGSPSNTVSL